MQVIAFTSFLRETLLFVWHLSKAGELHNCWDKLGTPDKASTVDYFLWSVESCEMKAVQCKEKVRFVASMGPSYYETGRQSLQLIT